LSANSPPVRISAASLRTKLQPARDELASHGCARAVGRPIPGVNAFSAPAFGHDGDPALVITLLGHQDNVPSAWSSPMAAAVKRAAAEISGQLGHRTAT
jgi:DNA-binding IclR family transcriptional regulator